jgi:hypothetical protein
MLHIHTQSKCGQRERVVCYSALSCSWQCPLRLLAASYMLRPLLIPPMPRLPRLGQRHRCNLMGRSRLESSSLRSASL